MPSLPSTAGGDESPTAFVLPAAASPGGGYFSSELAILRSKGGARLKKMSAAARNDRMVVLCAVGIEPRALKYDGKRILA